VSNDDDPLRAAEPSFAAVLRQSLFGKDELEALQAPPGKGLAPAPPRRVGRLCLESQGVNIHAATRVRECARDRLEHLVRYVCRPAIEAKRLEAVGPHHVRIWLKYMVLESLVAWPSLPQPHFWRDKEQREVDFVLPHRDGPADCIECKWSAASFSPKGLAAFRNLHPIGKNFVAAPDVSAGYTRTCGDLTVQFTSLVGLRDGLKIE